MKYTIEQLESYRKLQEKLNTIAETYLKTRGIKYDVIYDLRLCKGADNNFYLSFTSEYTCYGSTERDDHYVDLDFLLDDNHEEMIRQQAEDANRKAEEARLERERQLRHEWEASERREYERLQKKYGSA